MNGAEFASPAQCSPDRLLKLIGRRGMSEVWLADRTDGFLKRPVALKLLFMGLAGRFSPRGSIAKRTFLPVSCIRAAPGSMTRVSQHRGAHFCSGICRRRQPFGLL